jgi:hypothetical protein
LTDSLPQQLEQGMIRVPDRSWVINFGRRAIEDVETLIHLPHDRKTCIAGDLCALKINADGSVEIRPYGSPLLVTNCAHAACPPFDEFTTQYHMVGVNAV